MAEQQFADLVGRGFRVLAVATRCLPRARTITASDEDEMVLVGLLAFHDPVKQTAASAIADLRDLGIRVVVITGDHHLAARATAQRVGLDSDLVLTGPEIASQTDEQLLAVLDSCDVYAQIEPLQKERLIRLMRAQGAGVGLLGDGINDAAALQAADVGISVDRAVDVARQAASIVLLDKDLGVVVDGIRLGRSTFANTLKYVRVTISANFGNVLSMAAASAFLPFLPLLPLQILLLNFMSDIPALSIAEDSVDPEDLQRPRTWDIRSIVVFMVTFGVVSSVFDIATFAVLRLGFDASGETFRSGWFIESTATELVAMLVLRTSRPFWRSRPSSVLLWSSIGVAAVTALLPYSPIAPALGLTGLPVTILIVLIGMILGYVAANEGMKVFRRRAGNVALA
jgi:Mg2+-importing ATPase